MAMPGKLYHTQNIQAACLASSQSLVPSRHSVHASAWHRQDLAGRDKMTSMDADSSLTGAP
eukprot:1162142-Pelagomonas_calceolata.AAC.22